jgi:hypothetical protein
MPGHNQREKTEIVGNIRNGYARISFVSSDTIFTNDVETTLVVNDEEVQSLPVENNYKLARYMCSDPSIEVYYFEGTDRYEYRNIPTKNETCTLYFNTVNEYD